MKKIAIIEARMSSTRLPGKVLRPIMGRPMLALLVERLQGAQQLDGVVVATTINPADDPIETLTREWGLAASEAVRKTSWVVFCRLLMPLRQMS